MESRVTQQLSDEIRKRAGQAVSYEGTDVFSDTAAHVGNWKAFQVWSATAAISVLSDDGDVPSTGLTGANMLAGAFASANGNFVTITLTGGTIAFSRSQ